MFFKTFDQALETLSIPNGQWCITIGHSKDSYESFSHGGNVLLCIGQGLKRSPGHPSGHQSLETQMLLKSSQHLYPTFRIYSNYVEYMGTYRLISYSKKMSFQGFMYYEYKLFREKKFILQGKSKSKVSFDLQKTPHKTEAETVTDPVVTVNQVKLVSVVGPEVTCLPSC